MARGNRRESIYRDDRDRLAWLDYLSQASSRREKGVVFWEPGVRERLLALLPRTDADVRTDQGQHYEAAVLMKDAAEEKAERIFIRELRAAGLAEKALRAATKRAAQMENRPDHAHRNRGVPRMDSPPTRPWVSLECLPQNATRFNIQVLTPFFVPNIQVLTRMALR